MQVTKIQKNQQTLLAALRRGDLSSERSKEYWEEQEDHDLKRDFKDGKGISEIALRLQRSENAVVQRLISMRMLTPPSQRRHRSKQKKKKCSCPRCVENACPKYSRKDGTCHA